MIRKIVKIDSEKCNGCGLCIGACAEGAIQLVDGKAALVKDIYCDGLGACLGECPQGAITIEERDAAEFDEQAVKSRLDKLAAQSNKPAHHSGCPGMQAMSIKREICPDNKPDGKIDTASELQQWPIQLHLVPVMAPYWEGADLLLCADCVAVSYGNFQRDLLRGRKIIIACPKLDDTGSYLEKLTEIISNNAINSVTAARMEVPCCSGITGLAQKAIAGSGKNIPFNEIIVGINGQINNPTTTKA